MFFPDGTLSAVTCALLLGLTCLTALCDLAKGSADFSGQEVQHFGGAVECLSCVLASPSPVPPVSERRYQCRIHSSARLDPCLWRASARTPQCLLHKSSRTRL